MNIWTAENHGKTEAQKTVKSDGTTVENSFSSVFFSFFLSFLFLCLFLFFFFYFFTANFGSVTVIFEDFYLKKIIFKCLLSCTVSALRRLTILDSRLLFQLTVIKHCRYLFARVKKKSKKFSFTFFLIIVDVALKTHSCLLCVCTHSHMHK